MLGHLGPLGPYVDLMLGHLGPLGPYVGPLLQKVNEFFFFFGIHNASASSRIQLYRQKCKVYQPLKFHFIYYLGTMLISGSLRYVTLCYVMLCYVTLCYVMLRFVTLNLFGYTIIGPP